MASSSSSSSPEISHAAAHLAVSEPFSFKYASQEDVLEDLSSRFILNLPDEELASVERICFQVEQAHWYYEDFIREENPKFPSLPLKKFSAMLFNACPLLRQWSHDHEQAFNTFMQYKTRVPVCGAIMLNDKWDKCVLVKGWKSSSGWGFPKGKINQDEEPYRCAVREVLEETGYDLGTQIRPADCMEMTIKEQRITLYVVGGVPEDYPFQTRTRKEISKIEWFNLSDLPTWRRNKQVSGKFYLISPFVPLLKEFIKVNKQSRRRQNRRKDTVRESADLSVHTDLDQGIEENTSPGVIEDASYMVVGLDRDAHGSSSSSADNGEPQTPSPQCTEAYPVDSPEIVNGLTESSVDPHFARLLSGLSLSASKPMSEGQQVMRVETILSGIAETSVGEDETVNSSSLLPSAGVYSPSKQILPLKSPLRTGETPLPPLLGSSGSSNTTVPSDIHRLASQELLSTATPPVEDRHLKHLALLESVAMESSVSSPGQTQLGPGFVHQNFYGGGTSRPLYSVPPPSGTHDLSGCPQMLPMNQIPRFVSFTSPILPKINDPFSARPLSSNAAFPPVPSVRRHGPNASMHQGYLLSILGGANEPHMQGRPRSSFHPHHLSNNFGGTAAYPLSAISHPPFPTRVHVEAHGPQPLRALPPPLNIFQNNVGILSALSVSLGPPVPAVKSGNGLQSSNRNHLLSLLSPRTNPTFIAGPARPNFPTQTPSEFDP